MYKTLDWDNIQMGCDQFKCTEPHLNRAQWRDTAVGSLRSLPSVLIVESHDGEPHDVYLWT